MHRRLAITAASAVAGLLLLSACTPAGSPQEHINNVFGSAAGQATAVADCESSMNPGAVSSGGGNHGLFQINTVHKSSFSSVTGQPWSAVYDPYWNTYFAKWLYDQSGWSPWSCRSVL